MKSANNLGSVIIKLGIGCVVCLFLGAAVLLYAQERTRPRFIGTSARIDSAQTRGMAATRMQRMDGAPGQPQSNRAWGRQNRGGGVDFGENAAFYKTIIDHNLFRPLGWTPPKNEPMYSLVGTKAVDANGAISQATLLEKRSNRYHFVTVGTKLGDITVKDIQAKQVILDKAGETVTLKTGGFQPLTVKRERGGDRGGDRDEGGSERASNNNTRQNRANQANTGRSGQIGRGEQDAAQQARRREMMERFRNASGAERQGMIQQFRRRGDGGRRGRGRDR
ncbi:MAG: hypothetical protein OXL96_01425 [Candidatus Poribacteria bacterium]|nr:hypothetical protein [Candidatus Poribacteria bacterium]